MEEYSNIIELVKSIMKICNAKVIDGWRENGWWVSVLKGETSYVMDKETGEWKSYQKGCFRIKMLIPE